MLAALVVGIVVGATLLTQHAVTPLRSLALHVRVDQDAGLSSDELARLIAELRMIWSDAGVDVTSGRYADPIPAGRAVVSLRLVGEEWTRERRPVLGWVHGTDGRERIPIIFLSAPGVRRFLGASQFRGQPLNQRPRAVLDLLTAQALGRIAAHELGHYLLDTDKHEPRGLMRATYSPEDLIDASRGRITIPLRERVSVKQALSNLAELQQASR